MTSGGSSIVSTMATRLGIRELRDKLPAMLRRVRAGETIEVTHHGVPIALISPVPKDRIEHLIAIGAARPGKPLDRPIVPLPSTTGITASEALEEERASYEF